MDVMKKVLNVFGILIAIVLSVVLTIILMVVPVLSAASSFTQGEAVHKVMEEIDYSEVIASSVVSSGAGSSDGISSDEELSADVVDAAEAQGISGEVVQNLMGTEAVGEVLDLYMDDAFAAMEGNTEDVSLTPEALQEIASEHMDELVVIAKDFLGEDVELTDEQVSDFVNQTVEENADMIIEMLPPVEELLPVQQSPQAQQGESLEQSLQGEVSVQDEDSQAVQENITPVVQEANATSPENMLMDTLINLRNGKTVMSVIIAVVVFSLLILVCRIKRFQGFIWLGVVYLISATLTLVSSLLVGGSGLTELFDMGVMGAFVGPVLSVLSAEMKKSALAIAICAVVFIVIFAIGRAILKKKAVQVTEDA